MARESRQILLLLASHVTCHVTHGLSLMTRQTDAMAEKQLVMLSSVRDGFWEGGRGERVHAHY